MFEKELDDEFNAVIESFSKTRRKLPKVKPEGYKTRNSVKNPSLKIAKQRDKAKLNKGF